MIENPYNSPAACARFDDELAPYLEGESRPFIAAHSQDCAHCGAVLADLRMIRAAAQDLPLQAPSPGLWTKLRASLEAEGAFETAACTQFEAELEAHLEGEARPFVIVHSKDCAPCGALLADLQAMRIAAKALPQETPAPALWASLRSRLEAEGAFAVAACAQFEGELQGYLEGEERPFVPAHAKDCGPCGALLADMQAIRQAAGELPPAEPSRVVWANVRAQLESEGAFGVPVSSWQRITGWRWLSHVAPLGTLAGLIVVGAILAIPSLSVRSWKAATDAATESANSPAVAKLASLATGGEDGTLASVVSDLEKSFRASEASMAPDVKATYDKSLVTLDGSIHECLDSLQQEPGNTLARDYLLTAYTRKAEVLSSALEFEGR